MAIQIYATFKGVKQGDFRGDSTEKGREGMIVGVGFSYGVISPRDTTSGLPTGKRQEQPIVFTKEWSVCSPQFYTAAYTNVRRFLHDGVRPPTDAVRVEELVNYFDYGYARPADRATPFRAYVALAPSPWSSRRMYGYPWAAARRCAASRRWPPACRPR